jgi:integrase/recombinase XerD
LNEAAARQKKQKVVYNSLKFPIPEAYNKKEYTMKSSEVKRFASLYERHLKLLKLQGKSESTISSYSRAVRRIRDHFDCCPDKLTKVQLENYFGDLVESHSWSTVKIDRLGLMFFWKHVLEQDWQWLDIVKPPKIKSIPDILTQSEVAQLICATKKLRYRVFLLATYSMGLRLTEALSLQVGDIDGERKLVHIRRGKGHKDRMVPLPERTLDALRVLWSKHRHPTFLFPNAKGSLKTIKQATTHMNIGGTQNAMKTVVRECNIKKKSLFIPSVIPSQPIFLNVA